MKMKHHSRIKNKKKNIIIVIIVIIILAVLFWQFLGGLKIINQILTWQQNLACQSEQREIIVDLNDYYFWENIKLREKLNYQVNFQKENKTFFVVQSGKNNLYDTFLIADPQEILEKDDIVLAGFNFAIGRIIKSGKFSKMKLFSTVGEKNNFWLVDAEKNMKFKTEVLGEGGGILKVVVDREREVSQNTVLKLIADDEYVVAKLVKEKFKTQDPQRILYFQILANPYILDKVEVMK